MKWCSLFLTPPFKAVHRTAGRNTSRTAEFTNSGVWFCFKEQKGKGKTKLSENEEEKPWGKNGFSCRVFRGLGVRFIRYQLSSGTEGPPPARRRRLSRCAGPAGGCAAAAAGRGGWRAGPPGSSRRTGSGCTRRRSPASAHGWPGRSPAECLCPREQEQTGRLTRHAADARWWCPGAGQGRPGLALGSADRNCHLCLPDPVPSPLNCRIIWPSRGWFWVWKR